jgi:Glu-tRNA(Gln) amidotransferase subunit E-like FAD-binding protein
MSADLAEQLVMSPYFGLYWKIEDDGRIPANRVARVLVQEIRAAKRKGGNPEKIPEDAWLKLFELLRSGELLWEAVPLLIQHRSRRPGAEWLTIASKQHLLPLDEADWSSMVESLLHVPSRAKTKEGRVRWLMGQLQRPAGRIPGKQVAELLTKKVAELDR